MIFAAPRFESILLRSALLCIVALICHSDDHIDNEVKQTTGAGHYALSIGHFLNALVREFARASVRLS
jgi:hypothetical protein